MPTIFAKWNGKANSLKQLSTLSSTRYGRGISSTDLAPGNEDATQLTEVPNPPSKTDMHDSVGHDEPSIQRMASAQHLPGTSLSEFGVVPPSAVPSQRAKTGHRVKAGIETRLMSSKGTSASLSTIRRPSTADSAAPTPLQPPSYGYTTIGWDSQMDIARAVEVVLACGEQIRARGLDSPLIFSSMALDLSSHNVTSLIRSFLNTTSLFFSSDVKFANPHDLAAVLKWTIARLGRVFPVPIPSHEQSPRRGDQPGEESVLVHQRGFLDWDVYKRWTALEKQNGYPATAFSSFLDNLSSSSLALLVALFSLLSSTTCYSTKNGMTPSRLSRLFGPLLFGLPEDETFEKTYEAFVKAGNATEHLLLAYIRDSGTIETLPTRLADHVQGYPAMLSPDIAKPSRSVRGVPMTHVNRTVRLYSLDILQTACEMDVADQSSEWKACCSDSDAVGKDPQISDRFRKMINFRGGKKQGRSLNTPKQEVEIEHYASLVDKKWGDFMHEGFSAPDESKLTFDLRESERKARKERPGSVHWSQFEKSGFVIADDGLASVLSFDDGLKEDMQRWPAERAELMEKLRKATQKIPDFPYDTKPYVVSSPSLDRDARGQWEKKPVSRFDEVFAEVFADILLGNGWSNRDEQTHRNSNFAVVQYKSRPTPSTVGSQSAGASNQTKGHVGVPDDRVDAAWFVVEEIVPSQYRNELEASGRLKNRSGPSLRKLNIFKRRKEEGGAGPTSKLFQGDRSSIDDVFRLGSGGATKRLNLGKEPSPYSSSLDRKSSVSTVRQGQLGIEGEEGGNVGGSKLMTTLRSRTIKMRKRTKDDIELPPPTPPKNGTTQSNSFGSEDFDTRSLHDPDLDEFNEGNNRKRGLLKTAKRQSKDDSWLDVMIRANGFRMAGQDAAMPSSGILAERDQNTSSSPLMRTDKTPSRDSTPTFSKAKAEVSPVASLAIQDASTGFNLQTRSSPSPPAKRKLVSDADSSTSHTNDSLQVAGWTREDSHTPTPPKREASLPLMMPDRSVEERRTPSPLARPITARTSSSSSSIAPPIPQKSKAREEAREEQLSKEDRNDTVDEEDSPAKLAYLRPLPPMSSMPSEIDEREKARGVRIQAAKDRARELRASLNPIAIKELESKKEGTPVKPLSVLLTPVKSPAREMARTPSPSSTTSSTWNKSLSPKDDPFAKDRFSGRVASVASKFGGGGTAAGSTAGKPITPQSTGNSVKAVSPNPGGSGDKFNSSSSSVTPSRPPYPPPRLAVEPSTMDPNEPDMESNNALGMDNDSIYPDDAASNFSRDTEPEEKTSLRLGGSNAAAATLAPPVPAPSPTDSDHFMTPDLGRAEEEDQAMAMPPFFRVPYQPGMPLSNLEEESESVMSGSNNA